MSTTPTPPGDAPTLLGLLAAGGTGFDSDPGNYSILQAALAATGLDAALADPDTSLTLLAPTDAAFLDLARSLGYAGTDEEEAFQAIADALATLAPDGDPIPLLADILRYHVLGGAYTETEVLRAVSLDTLLTDAPLSAFGRALPDADPDAPDARLVPGAEQAAGNGVLLPIDAVRLPVDIPNQGNVEAAPPSIAALIAASGTGYDGDASDFDMLREALGAASLTAALDDPDADLTLFAPTDAAFLALARELGYQGGDEGEALTAILDTLGQLGGGDPIPLLTDILLGHVVEGTVSRQQAEGAGSLETLGGTTITIERSVIGDADPELRDARFAPGATNIEASNGAVQTIDRVILPLDLDTGADDTARTIADELSESGVGFDNNLQDFDILNAALGAAGLTAALDDPDAALTLFAPTDAAFVDLARALGWEGRGEAGAFDAIVAALTDLGGGDPIPLLTDILLAHVAPEALSAAEVIAGDPVATLGGFEIDPFGQQLEDGDPTLADPALLGRRVDLPATNGVIHAIDGVILPIDVAEATGTEAPPPTITGIVAASGDGFDADTADFDMLKAALDAAGLTATLDDPAASLTVLAPTDAGFVALAHGLGYAGTDEAGAFGAIVAALTGLGGGDPIPLLSEILLTHVIEGRSSRQELSAEDDVATLSGYELDFAPGLQVVDAEDQTDIRFLREAQNIEAANGAVHAIDGVLLPFDLALV